MMGTALPVRQFGSVRATLSGEVSKSNGRGRGLKPFTELFDLSIF
jgi:hypothetical protein